MSRRDNTHGFTNREPDVLEGSVLLAIVTELHPDHWPGWVLKIEEEAGRIPWVVHDAIADAADGKFAEDSTIRGEQLKAAHRGACDKCQGDTEPGIPWRSVAHCKRCGRVQSSVQADEDRRRRALRAWAQSEIWGSNEPR